MPKNIIYLLTCVLFYNTIACSQTSNPENKTISVNLTKGQSIFFSYYDKDYNLKGLEFSYKNGFSSDSTIIKELNIGNLYFEYFAVFGSENGNIYQNKESFFSGLENINFQIGKNFELLINNEQPILISKYLNIKNSNTKPLLIDNSEIIKFYDEIKSIYAKNLKIIDSLYNDNFINQTKYNYWLDINKLIYNQRLLSTLEKNSKFFSLIKNYISETEIEVDLTKMKYLSSSVYWGVLYSLAQYKALNKNLDFQNPKVFVESIYSCKNPRAALKIIGARLKNFPNKNNPDFLAALKLSKDFSGDTLIKEWEYLLKQVTKKELLSASLIKLESTSLKPINFQEILNKNKGFITFIDLWAHWCIPCRNQLPILQKFKEVNKGLPIKFVTISLDEEKHVKLWLKAISEEKLTNDPLQFRLQNPKTSLLTKQLQIETIPRYLVLGRNGEIISDNFYLPIDKEFRNELLKIVNEN
jgi:thiol-disulfide isomerase/thioredoxin